MIMTIAELMAANGFKFDGAFLYNDMIKKYGAYEKKPVTVSPIEEKPAANPEKKEDWHFKFPSFKKGNQ